MDSTARLGPYEIKGFLTDVGLDDLYLGTDTLRETEILLRLLSLFLEEAETIDRLRDHARRIASLGHPHLLPLSRVEKSDGPVLAVAERAPGSALDHFVPAGGLSCTDVLRLSVALAGALAALHRDEMVHGYLHPGRIIVSEGGNLKLLVIGPEEATGSPTPRVAACQAPEVLDGAELDPQAEVFALGVLVHLIAIGELPFRGETTAAVRESIRHDPAPRLNDERSDLPDMFTRVIRRCLEKDRAWRYETADEVYRDLTALDEVVATLDPTDSADAAPSPDAPADLGVPADAEPRLRLVRQSASEPSGHVAPTHAFGSGGDAGFETSRALAAELLPAAGPEIAPESETEPEQGPDTEDTPASEQAADAEGTPESEQPADAKEAPESKRPADAKETLEPEPTPAAEDADETTDPIEGSPATQLPAAEQRPAARLSAARNPAGSNDWRLPAAGVGLLVVGVTIGWIAGGFASGTDEPPVTMSLRPATSAPGPELFPQLSPDGTRLYYAHAEDGDWGVYAQDIAGEEVIELTADSPFGDSQPALSADGSRIAFRSERDGGGTFVMDTQGAGVRKLADFGHNPAWSPDGEELAVATAPVYDTPYPGVAGEIIAIDTSTGQQRPVVAAGMQPHWSPGGERIAYWSSRGTTATDIWTIPAAGGEPVAVTNDSAIDWNPVWSPAGDELYFVSNRGGGENIWRVAIDAGSGALLGNPEPVTTTGAVRTLHPAFAGDSGTMVYAEALVRRNLYRIPFDASAGATRGGPELMPGIPVGASAPDVASDAGRIAFLLPSGDHDQVWVSGLDGDDALPITDRAVEVRNPRLSPDGRNVAFLSDQSGSLQLWTAPASGGMAHRHTELTTGKISQPLWSRDGAGIGMSVGGSMMPSYTLLFNARQTADEQVADTLLSTPSDATFEPHSWSRDGNRIAGSIRRGDGRLAGIAVLRVGAEEAEPIADYGMNPVWLRDGRRLLFQWGTSLYLVDSNAPEPRVVFSSVPDRLGEVFSVSSDDRWIYVSLDRREADAWLLQR